jgi:hypothetical protein
MRSHLVASSCSEDVGVPPNKEYRVRVWEALPVVVLDC